MQLEIWRGNSWNYNRYFIIFPDCYNSYYLFGLQTSISVVSFVEIYYFFGLHAVLIKKNQITLCDYSRLIKIFEVTLTL